MEFGFAGTTLKLQQRQYEKRRRPGRCGSVGRCGRLPVTAAAAASPAKARFGFPPPLLARLVAAQSIAAQYVSTPSRPVIPRIDLSRIPQTCPVVLRL